MFDRETKSSYLLEVQSVDGWESARPGKHGQPNSGKRKWEWHCLEQLVTAPMARLWLPWCFYSLSNMVPSPGWVLRTAVVKAVTESRGGTATVSPIKKKSKKTPQRVEVKPNCDTKAQHLIFIWVIMWVCLMAAEQTLLMKASLRGNEFVKPSYWKHKILETGPNCSTARSFRLCRCSFLVVFGWIQQGGRNNTCCWHIFASVGLILMWVSCRFPESRACRLWVDAHFRALTYRCFLCILHMYTHTYMA